MTTLEDLRVAAEYAANKIEEIVARRQRERDHAHERSALEGASWPSALHYICMCGRCWVVGKEPL